MPEFERRGEAFKAIWEKLDQLTKALDSEPWQEANVVALDLWTVPEGKVYEVFAYISADDILYTGDWRPIVDYRSMARYSISNIWFPCNFHECIAFTSGGGIIQYGWTYSRSSHGWILTGGEVLFSENNWRVRWRERKDLGSQ